MKNLDDFTFSLLDDLYAAATCRQAWLRFVGRLQSAWLCEGVHLLVDADAGSERPTGSADISPHGKPAQSTVTVAGETCETLVVRWGPGRERLLHWEPAEDGRFLGGACGLGLSMPKDARQGAKMGSEEMKNAYLRLLSFLQPHLERVSRQAAEAAQAEAQRDEEAEHGFGWFAEIFDTPVVHVDGNGHVLEMSSIAVQALAKGGLHLKGTRLSACRMDEDAVLREMIARASGLARGPAAVDVARKFSAAIQFSRKQTTPLGAIFVGVAGQRGVPGTALVFLFDHSLQASSRAPLLRQLFRLSPTEVRLVDALLQGQRLKSAAQALRLTENTARFHLKEIFRKVGVNCQVDLLRAVLALPGGIDFAGDLAPVGRTRQPTASRVPEGARGDRECDHGRGTADEALVRTDWALTTNQAQGKHLVPRIRLRTGSLRWVSDVITPDLMHKQRLAGLRLQLRLQ